MAYSNSRVTFSTYTTSGITYSVYVSGSAVFNGRFDTDTSGTYKVDITEILKPYVHAEELTSLTSGSGPTSAAWNIAAVGGTASPSSGTLSYLNDFAATSIPSGAVLPQDWGQKKINGQYYFSFSGQGAWTGSQYGSVPDTCQYNAEIIFTDVYGMPQGVPVKAISSVNCEWQGYNVFQDYQSKGHRTKPVEAEKQMSFTCYTPSLDAQNRKKLVRWLGQAEYVYLYDIDKGELYPCTTPQMADTNQRIVKLTIQLTTNY